MNLIGWMSRQRSLLEKRFYHNIQYSSRNCSLATRDLVNTKFTHCTFATIYYTYFINLNSFLCFCCFFIWVNMCLFTIYISSFISIYIIYRVIFLKCECVFSSSKLK
jgi:hypothetical protein